MVGGGFYNPSIASFVSDTNASVANADADYNNVMNQRVGEPSVTSLLWGKVIPITYGTRKVLGQVIQLGERKQTTSIDYAYSSANNGAGGTSEYIQTKDTNVNIKATFAVAFGAPGNPGSKQILKKLWLNKVLVYDLENAAVSSVLNFKFYEGTEDQIADETLNAQFVFPLAYRGLMYMPVYDYSQSFSSLVAGQSNPLIEAEIVEQLNNNQDVVTYEELEGVAPPNGNIPSTVFDWRTGYIYTIREDNNIYKYSTREKVGVEIYPVDTSGLTTTFYAQSLAFTRVSGINYIIGQRSASNSRTVYLIEADTGSIVDSVGVTNNSLLQDATHITALTDMSVDEYGSYSLLDCGTVFGGYYRFRVMANSIEVVTVISSDAFTDGDRDLVSGGGGYAFAVMGNSVDLISPSGTRTAGWYTMPQDDIMHAMYSPVDHTVIFFGSSTLDNETWEIRKVHVTTKETIWSKLSADYPELGVPSAKHTAVSWRNKSYTLDNRVIAWAGVGDSIGVLNTYSGTIDVIPQSNTFNEYGIYDGYTNRLIGTNSSDEIIDFPIVNPNSTGYPLSALLINLAERQGYETADITVQNIGDTIIGAAITQISDIAVLLNDLRIAYNFTIRKKGRKITFSRRVLGASFAVDAEITESARGILSEDSDTFVTVKSQRIATRDVPATINLYYIDPDQDYIQTLVTHTRNDDQALAATQLDLRLPVIITASDAFTLATRITTEAAEGQLQHELLLPQKYSTLEQGDCLRLIFDEYSDVVRVDQIDYNGDKSVLIKGTVINVSAVPEYTLDDLPIVDTPPSPIEDASQPLLFDIPLLLPSDQGVVDALETYYGLVPAGRTDVTEGIIVKQATDGAQEVWAFADGVLTYGRVRGDLLNTGVACTLDREASMTFRIAQGDYTLFESNDLEDVLAGLNRVLVGNQGRWELIGYLDASYDSVSSSVTLSGLIRGLRGTDINVNNHLSNDYAVFVGEGVGMSAAPLDDLDERATYIAQAMTGTLWTQYGAILTQLGASRRPFAVAGVHAVAAGGDVELGWHRRTRLDGPLLNGTPDVPLDEESEAYEVDIYRAGTIVRTVTGLSSSAFTYTAAMQAADGWVGAVTSVQLDIYQISALVGRGFARSGVYDVE